MELDTSYNGSVALFRQPITPTAHYADNPLLRQPITPTTHYSDSPYFRQPIILLSKEFSLWHRGQENKQQSTKQLTANLADEVHELTIKCEWTQMFQKSMQLLHIWLLQYKVAQVCRVALGQFRTGQSHPMKRK